MTDDIVARLRSPEVFLMTSGMVSPVAEKAADEIERLRAALGDLIAACDAGRPFERGNGGMTIEAQLARTVINGVRAIAVEDARAALEGEKTDDVAP